MADDADEQLYTLITLIVDVQWFRAFQKVDDAASRQQSKNLIINNGTSSKNQCSVHCTMSSAQRVGFFNIGLGRVFDKIPGSGSGSGRVGVSKYMIGYLQVSFLLSGIFGYFGYFWACQVFLGISGLIHIY